MGTRRGAPKNALLSSLFSDDLISLRKTAKSSQYVIFDKSSCYLNNICDYLLVAAGGMLLHRDP